MLVGLQGNSRSMMDLWLVRGGHSAAPPGPCSCRPYIPRAERWRACAARCGAERSLLAARRGWAERRPGGRGRKKSDQQALPSLALHHPSPSSIHPSPSPSPLLPLSLAPSPPPPLSLPQALPRLPPLAFPQHRAPLARMGRRSASRNRREPAKASLGTRSRVDGHEVLGVARPVEGERTTCSPIIS